MFYIYIRTYPICYLLPSTPWIWFHGLDTCKYCAPLYLIIVTVDKVSKVEKVKVVAVIQTMQILNTSDYVSSTENDRRGLVNTGISLPSSWKSRISTSNSALTWIIFLFCTVCKSLRHHMYVCVCNIPVFK